MACWLSRLVVVAVMAEWLFLSMRCWRKMAWDCLQASVDGAVQEELVAMLMLSDLVIFIQKAIEQQGSWLSPSAVVAVMAVTVTVVQCILMV